MRKRERKKMKRTVHKDIKAITCRKGLWNKMDGLLSGAKGKVVRHKAGITG
jgi:hypothetical protein